MTQRGLSLTTVAVVVAYGIGGLAGYLVASAVNEKRALIFKANRPGLLDQTLRGGKCYELELPVKSFCVDQK